MALVPYVQAPVPLTGETQDLAAALERELRRISANLTDVTSGLNFFYPRTDEEKTASVTPTNYRYPAGDVRRYGALGDGSTDDRLAFVAAFASSAIVYIPNPPTQYIISAQIIVNKSNLYVYGDFHGGSGNGSGWLPAIKLTSTTAGDSIFAWTAYAENVIIDRVAMKLPANGHTLRCLSFTELRSSRISNCWMEGVGTTADDTYAIAFNTPTTAGHFTGDVTIYHNYITNHGNCIRALGAVTTTRIISNELTGTAAHASSIAYNGDTTNVGVLIQGNSFNQWNTGISWVGVGLRQIGNYFENCGTNWSWVRGGGNINIDAISLGDFRADGASIAFPKNTTDGCQVFSTNIGYMSNSAFESQAGYLEYARSANLGDATTYTLVQTANGAMTWTGGSAGTLEWAVWGHTMLIKFSITGTTVGGTPNTELRIGLPAGFAVATQAQIPFALTNNAVSAFGLASADNGNAYIRLFRDASGATNWTAGATVVSGQIQFKIS